MGAEVANVNNVSSFELNVPAGVYVINAVIDGVVHREKIIVR